MLRGLYSAAAGMITQQRKHDTVANNISNLNTVGYKQGNAVSRNFPEMLVALAGDSASGMRAPATIGRMHTGVYVEEILASFQQGDLFETGNPFDFSLLSDIQLPGVQLDASGKGTDENGRRVIQPQAFFTVINEEGELRFTRNGKFRVNPLGELVTAEGFRVVGQDGQPIVLIDADSGNPTFQVKVSERGALVDGLSGQPLNNAGGAQISLQISVVTDPYELVREGYTVYRLDNMDGLRALQPDDAVEIRQGFIERSNVDPAQSMVDMMAALRAYEANQKVLQTYDRSLEKAVSEVGRV